MSHLPPGCEPTTYTFTIPNPAFPDEPAFVHVVARRGPWDRGPIVAWNIVDSRGVPPDFWTRERIGFVYRPERPEDGRWTLEEALKEAAEHAVPFVEARMARRRGRL